VVAPVRRSAVESRYGWSDAGMLDSAEVMLPAMLASEAPGDAQTAEPEATLGEIGWSYDRMPST